MSWLISWLGGGSSGGVDSSYEQSSPPSSPKQSEQSTPKGTGYSTTDSHDVTPPPSSPKGEPSLGVTPPPPKYNSSEDPLSNKQRMAEYLHENFEPKTVAGGLGLALDVMTTVKNPDGATAVFESVEKNQHLLPRDDTEAYREFQKSETDAHRNASDDEYQTSTGKNLRGMSEETRANLHQVGALINGTIHEMLKDPVLQGS